MSLPQKLSPKFPPIVISRISPLSSHYVIWKPKIENIIQQIYCDHNFGLVLVILFMCRHRKLYAQVSEFTLYVRFGTTLLSPLF